MKRVVLNNKLNTNNIASSMGCRTYNGYDINFNFENVINDAMKGKHVDQFSANQKDGRGNICPVTIIMPTLAMEAKYLDGDPVENFITLLDKKIHEAKDMLIERFNYICSQSPESAKFMYENGTMIGYKPEEGIRSALKHGTLAIGQLGLAETLQILIGKNQLSEEGMELAKRIEALFKGRADEFKHQWHYLNGKPSAEYIFTHMVTEAENQLNRDLTKSEIAKIKEFISTKAYTPTENVC